MDFIDIYSKECEINLLKSSHYFESCYDIFIIKAKELEINKNLYNLVTESEESFILEASIQGLVDKVVKTIESIINAISFMITKIVDKITGKEYKKKIEELEKKIDEINDKVEIDNINKKKIDIHDDKKCKEELNKYIREMTKLERKLMTMRFDNMINPTMTDGKLIVECNLLIKEIDDLNDKYDKSFLEENKDIIEMASKDAIRFSKKQLDNVKVDYEAIEKGSKEVLMQFKKDADGCEIPIKLNILQKISNSIATRVRRVVNRVSSYRHRNLSAVLGIGALIAGITLISKNEKAKEKVKGMYKKGMEAINKKNEELEKQIAENMEKLSKNK